MIIKLGILERENPFINLNYPTATNRIALSQLIMIFGVPSKINNLNIIVDKKCNNRNF